MTPELRRVVIAGASNGTEYINNFCEAEASASGLGLLASHLAEVWDFNSEISTPGMALDASKIFGKTIRAYYQANALPAGAPLGSVLINSQPTRWRNYLERGPADPKEVPPLPPERTNSSVNPANPSQDGRDTPRPPGSTPGLIYTHHLIRDFMFLDATAANQAAGGAPAPIAPRFPKAFSVRFRSHAPTAEDSEFTRGTGRHAVLNKKLLGTIPAGAAPFTYLSDDLSFATLLYELVDLTGSPADGSRFSPNWFGVAVPDGITDFTNVVIYFHPTPGQAGYNDVDYASKSNGGNPTRANWTQLLGYVDRLGSQLSGAVKTRGATPNQVVIVPLMRNQNVDGGVLGAPGSPGILPRQWFHIVSDIIKDLPTRLPTL